jgi:predicted small lipoprotein YifL
MKIQIILASLLLLAACASKGHMPAPPSDIDIIDAKISVRCASKEQCDRWWRATQVWVVKNSGYTIQIVTDTILQTFNAAPDSSAWAFQITRSPDLGGGEIFEINGSCGRLAACSPVYETVIADFKRTIIKIK